MRINNNIFLYNKKIFKFFLNKCIVFKNLLVCEKAVLVIIEVVYLLYYSLFNLKLQIDELKFLEK